MNKKPIDRWAYILIPASLMILILIVNFGTLAQPVSPIEAAYKIDSPAGESTIHWTGTLTGTGRINDVIQTSDGRYVAIGTDYVVSSSYGFMTKLTPDASMVWQKKYTDSDFEDMTFDAVVELSDNNLVVVGKYQLGSGGREAAVTKFDPDGNLIWQRQIGASFAQAAPELIALDNGHVLVIATDQGEISDGWLARLDGSGNVVWQKRYGGDSVDHFYGGLRTSDGNIVIYGLTWKAFEYIAADAWLLKINPNGDILWQKSYDNFWADYLTDMIETADGDLVASGATNSGFSSTYPWAVKFSADGNLLWHREWPLDNINSFSSVVQGESGRLFFVGSYKDDNFISRGWLVTLDEETGQPLYQKFYGSNDQDDGFAKIIKTNDDDLLIVGETETYGLSPQDGWLLKVPESGNFPDCAVMTTAAIPSNPTTVSTASTTHLSQNTTYTVTPKSATVQDLIGPVVAQCYYQLDFTNESYLPAVRLAD